MTRAAHAEGVQAIEPNVFIAIIVVCIALLCAIAASASESTSVSRPSPSAPQHDTAGLGRITA